MNCNARKHGRGFPDSGKESFAGGPTSLACRPPIFRARHSLFVVGANVGQAALALLAFVATVAMSFL